MESFIKAFPGDNIWVTEYAAQVILFIILCISGGGAESIWQ